ncbi:TssQ family T6SS-associated lipoprotein [Trinickia fusca]|uniref:TssQ family T6SS-associated lipoprotein n=1 Tax=Trinickia fusca TaxID=2419777 RepID=UPI001FEAF392|nr:TssQ family T6SS-associated lipoprotein [Trinickia fusca]
MSPNQRVADETLQAAHVSYTAGDYSRTIQLLRDSSEIETSDRRTRVEAHKLMAFSYCVIGRITLCRVEFERVLQLDPHFELSTAEKGHPIWGPAFEAARKHVASS